MKKLSIAIAALFLFAGCVSKKKFIELETEKNKVVSELEATKSLNKDLEMKFSAIEKRINDYNSKISSLQEENNEKLVNIEGIVISENQKTAMRETLKNVPAEALAGAKTLKDSMNLAVQYNLNKSVSGLKENENISVNIEETIVVISLSDDILFNSGSFTLSSKANPILQKIANVVNSEESLELMIEGHTDNLGFEPTPFLQDNWDLSVLRATSVVKKLQNTYKVDPSKLIASGRSSYAPVVENDSKENRAKNRRTRIIILPNIDKFFALMSEKAKEEIKEVAK